MRPTLGYNTLPTLEAFVSGDNAEAAVFMAMTYVTAYTRGKGFDPDDGSPLPDIEAVIVSVAARLMNNPQMIAQVSTGPFQQSNMRWDGFTLLEQTVLNRYRIRAQ